jgi:hypothetical protein
MTVLSIELTAQASLLHHVHFVTTPGKTTLLLAHDCDLFLEVQVLPSQANKRANTRPPR